MEVSQKLFCPLPLGFDVACIFSSFNKNKNYEFFSKNKQKLGHELLSKTMALDV